MKEFIKKYFLVVLILVFSFVYAEIAKTPSPDSAEIYFLDVGQGDAELIQKGDFQILIDGGPSDVVLTELGKVMPLSDRKIDIIVLTHPHADHLAGLNLVLERYEIGQIYGSGVLNTTNGYIEFLNKIKDKGIKFKVAKLAETVVPFPDSELDFLWPGEKYLKQNLSNLNNSSLVTKFCYFSSCALFIGDIETDEQTEMFEYYSSEKSGDIFNADILKISHHGSRNGTNELTLKNIKPKYAVIEVGADNKYSHPHAETVSILKKLMIQILRTDQSGTIKFELTKTGVVKD